MTDLMETLLRPLSLLSSFVLASLILAVTRSLVQGRRSGLLP